MFLHIVFWMDGPIAIRTSPVVASTPLAYCMEVVMHSLPCNYKEGIWNDSGRPHPKALTSLLVCLAEGLRHRVARLALERALLTGAVTLVNFAWFHFGIGAWQMLLLSYGTFKCIPYLLNSNAPSMVTRTFFVTKKRAPHAFIQKYCLLSFGKAGLLPMH